MNSPALRKLVEESAVPLLTERINSLQTTVHNLQAHVFELCRDLQNYTTVVGKMACELNLRNSFAPTIREDGTKKYCRQPEAVAERWAEWKRLHEAGMSGSEIARRWGVHHSAVTHAMKNHFLVSKQRKPTTKEKPNHATNDSHSANGRSSRPVRRGEQPSNHGRQGTQRRLPALQA